jgi:autotransporter-associated beta strand protein
MKRFTIGSLTALAVALCASVAPAITHTWNGGNAFGPNSMANGLNWSGGTPVSSSSNLTLVFPVSASSLTPNQNIATPLELQSLQLASAYTFSGNAFQFNNLGAAPTITSTGAFSTIQNDIQFAAPTAVSVGGIQMDFNGALSGSPVTFSASSGTPFVNISGSAANSIQAIVNNDVQLHLNKTSAIVSSLDLNGGAVRVNASGGIAPGTNVTVNPTTVGVTFAPLEFFFNPNSIGALTLNGAGAAVVSTTLTVTGSITGTGSSVISQAFSSATPTLDLGGGTKIIDVVGATDLLQIHPLMTNGSFTKVGAGKLFLTNGFNSFSGTNTVNAGILAGPVSALGTSVVNNTVVELHGGTLTSNVISGPGQVVVVNSPVDFLAAQSYAGGTHLLTTAFGNTSTLLGNFTSGVGGSLSFNQNSNGTFSGTLSGPAQVFKQGSGVLSMGGNNPYTGDTFLTVGGLDIQSDTALGTGTIFVGGFNTTLQATGTRTIANPLQLGSSHSYVGSGNLAFTDTTPKSITGISMTHNSTGSTTIDGKFSATSSSSIVVNAGQLTLGDPALVNGFTSAGPVTVNGGTLTIRSLNFISLPDVTLAAGTLDVPNGYAIPLGAALQGTGNVTGRIATANGSTIIATGAMGLGDPFHPAGVNLDGELYTNQYLVSLSDSNQAVLGSLTDLGTATQNGTLTAGNGFVLNFGRNIVGRGQIVSNNLLNAASVINGSVQGDSITNYLEFTGYVKGVGTFNNVAFSGTFSPGLSPTLMTVGNVIYTPSTNLVMELGGLSRGGQYDAFDITGTMVLNGTLDIDLINAFSPSLGDQFLLFQGISGGSFVGAFSSFSFPALNPGLAWDTSLLYSNGILQVVAAVPEPGSLASLLLLSLVFASRRRV